jgi:hypothetical protein
MGGAPINDFDFRFREAVGVTSARSRGLSKDVAKMAEVFRGLYRTIAWAYVTNGMMAFFRGGVPRVRVRTRLRKPTLEREL